ncbi:alpha/beta hydrolase-fold protein [uncultured Flavobacterium sp.]|uniref:alpha/beta hydrolase-fold protein n=1 Tax=uncultured Flavobacterium sp. TaxID=165435 RepID=UPI0030CA2606
MKNNFNLIFVLFITAFTFSQNKTETVESSILDKTIKISVTTPPSYEIELKKQYPVFYLLDGTYLLNPFNGTLQYGYYFDDLPETILVGINTTNNERNTFFKGDSDGFPDKNSASFYEFITSELIPFINKNYRTVDYKVIAGHDLTAGFINFFLYKDSPVFDGYISLCPEFAFEMENRISERLNVIQKPVSYFQTTSQTDEASIYEKVSQLDKRLKTSTNTNLSYKYLQLDGFSHYSIVPLAIPQAIYHVYKDYQPINKDEYDTELKDQTSGYVTYLKNKYEKINTLYGVEKNIRLIDFLTIYNIVLKNGTLEELKELEKVAKKEYPKTTLVYVIESSYYEKMGDFDKAIKAIGKGYSAKNIGNFTKEFILEKLERLKKLHE